MAPQAAVGLPLTHSGHVTQQQHVSALEATCGAAVLAAPSQYRLACVMNIIGIKPLMPPWVRSLPCKPPHSLSPHIFTWIYAEVDVTVYCLLNGEASIRSPCA